LIPAIRLRNVLSVTGAGEAQLPRTIPVNSIVRGDVDHQHQDPDHYRLRKKLSLESLPIMGMQEADSREGPRGQTEVSSVDECVFGFGKAYGLLLKIGENAEIDCGGDFLILAPASVIVDYWAARIPGDYLRLKAALHVPAPLM
jgi:hypothetical protein